MKYRRQLISWCALETDARHCHVVPIRVSADAKRRKAILKRHMLGHVASDDVGCWCKPKRAIRPDGSLLFTHEDLTN